MEICGLLSIISKVTMIRGKVFGVDRCQYVKPLREYAWTVDTVRRHQEEKKDLDAAVDAAVDEMPDDFVIRDFILANRAEVKTMLLTEYNEEKVLEKERQEGRQEERRDLTGLMNYLLSNGRSEDALKASTDENFLNQLLAEFRSGLMGLMVAR